MAAPTWRVEFHRAAVRDLRKPGVDTEGRVLRYRRAIFLRGPTSALWTQPGNLAQCCVDPRLPTWAC
jgi:hypothetical protein